MKTKGAAVAVGFVRPVMECSPYRDLSDFGGCTTTFEVSVDGVTWLSIDEAVGREQRHAMLGAIRDQLETMRRRTARDSD